MIHEVEEFFGRMVEECNAKLGEPAGSRWFLNWFDETPREEVRRELLEEVCRELEERYAQQPVGVTAAAIPCEPSDEDEPPW
jgi:hypothetical protein